MQKIYFKKLVDLDHKLKELVSISVDESINYKMENQGMRAVGSIMINGEYKGEDEKKDFRESIDLDILAQFDKIADKREFHVKVEDFDYSFHEGNLALTIQACVYGVKDDEDRIIETTGIRESEASDEDIADEIETLLREEEMESVEAVVEKNEPVVLESETIIPVSESTQPQNVEKHKIQEVNEDEEDDLGTYYLYVVQDGDSYQSIAAHYQCDEYRLKEYNHERSLDKGTIVIVPYYS